ncbi:MAG: hypothetical protein JWO05_1331 [Gemmatimonadetes bacterium]|nr:hypothetical protein [Gemmatimonadota bacterium]
MTVCNDPDNTTVDAWQQVHELIWEELGLEWSDGLFVLSRNDALPDQVSLARDGDSLLRHPHDVIHTWGDFVGSRGRVFGREDAHVAMGLLERHGIRPRVWSDHATFEGNVMHERGLGASPMREDASGHRYENGAYTLDLIQAAGVRYLWDGEITNFIGQDVPVRRVDRLQELGVPAWRARAMSALAFLGRPLWRAVDARRFRVDRENRQYRRHAFPDGREFYVFRRYGEWKLADIDGLATILAPGRLDMLESRQGTCVIYTHLGKRRADRASGPRHVPEATRTALSDLARRRDAGTMILSSTSRLLDYLVLRDHARLDPRTGTIAFEPDGLRFSSLSAEILSAFAFGVHASSGGVRSVTIDGVAAEYELTPVDRQHAVLRIPSPARERDH